MIVWRRPPDASRSSGTGDLLLALSRRDRQWTVAALGVGTSAAWLYLALGLRSNAGMSHAMSSMRPMTTMSAWNAGETGIQLLMWIVMMVAMMLPAAVPATLVYVAVARKASRQGSPVAPASALIGGYIGVWLSFSIAATAAQWVLERLSLLSSSMASNDRYLAGALVLAAGVYQLTALKAQCLKRCRDPARLIAEHWRSGEAGAVRMGAELGLYCLGCCWVLMTLLFVGGVMNLAWVAAIATVVLLEKVAPRATEWSRYLGVAMMAGGAVVILA